MGNEVKLTRQELYEKVWSKSVLQLSKEFGISDVGLAKICRRHEIPIPAVGYWARVASGMRVAKTPLPRSSKTDAKQITIRPTMPKVERDLTEVEEAIELVNALNLPEKRKEHPITLELREMFRRPREKFRAVLRPSRLGFEGMKVTKGSLDAAIRTLDNLFVSLEALGFQVLPNFGRHVIATVVVLGERMDLSLGEVVTRKEKLPLNASQLKRKRETGYYYPEYDYIPTGRMRLRFWECGWKWGEHIMTNSKHSLEDRIPEIIRRMIRSAYEIRMKNIEREAAARKRAEEERLRLAREKLIKEEAARVERLLKDAENWALSQRLRDYIEAVRQRAAKTEGVVSNDLDRWLEWATLQADRLDGVDAFLMKTVSSSPSLRE